MQGLEPYRKQFFEMLVNQDIAGGMAVIEAAVTTGAMPDLMLLKIVNSAMNDIGRMQADREITLSEIYVIAKIAERAIDRLQTLGPDPAVPASTVIVGTAAGDYHGLGRKIVSAFLRAAGFRVCDLGMSVSSTDFVDAAVKEGAPIIAVSALLLHTARRVKDIRTTLHERGLEQKIKLVVGGAALNFDRQLYREIGADATGRNAADAVAVIRQIVRVVG